MADWPVYGGGMSRVVGLAPVEVTIGNSNSKGNWFECTAACLYPVSSLLVNFQGSIGSSITYLMDVGVGAAGSEVVVVANWSFSGSDAQTVANNVVELPFAIPAGTRIAVRGQKNHATAGTKIDVLMQLLSSGFPSRPYYAPGPTYGADVSDSGGTLVDPGGTDDTKGAWVELTPACTYPVRALFLSFGNWAAGTIPTATLLFDIGIGAAGSEVVVVPDIFQYTMTTGDYAQIPTFGTIPVNIPAGTRISVRAQSSYTTEAYRKLDVVLHTFI